MKEICESFKIRDIYCVPFIKGTENQIDPIQLGKRKISVTTQVSFINSNENDIVIDSCYIKTQVYDPMSHNSHLLVIPASKQTLQSRASVVGRIQNG
jgi:HrpA-like RNA helicase